MKLFLILVASTALNGFCAAQEARRNIPDISKIRGFNYESAPTIGHNEMWLQYNPAETARDMDYARRLNLNQVRVFLGYTAYLTNKPAFRSNLVDFIHVCHERGIGVMVVVPYPREWSTNQAEWPQAREYTADLVNTIGNGKEPGLAFWDVHNEPGYSRIQFARHMAGVFRELDKVTPITIGSTTEGEMEATGGDLVDVLCFHDYSSTRHQIDEHIERAKQYAASLGKQVMNTEIGCIARSNPYDVTLEEYMKSGMGWYIWELMITRQWGTVHGVFYADGTVRDPSIVAALLGFYRNRGPDVMPEVPDREGRVTAAVAANQQWLADTNADWQLGLDLAERSANLLEAAQLIAMHELPTRQVDLLRKGQPDMPALRALIQKFTTILEPYQLPEGDPLRSRPPGWIR
jgi:sugar phosphate isomerase/epimerase